MGEPLSFSSDQRTRDKIFLFSVDIAECLYTELNCIQFSIAEISFLYPTSMQRKLLPIILCSLALLHISGCSSKRQLAVDYPTAKTENLAPLPGYETVDGDDYYMQLVSDFNFLGDSMLKGGCDEISNHYENGNLSAALIFNVKNDALKLKQEVSGFLYEASTGKCNFRMSTKKANLTPWMRLDSAKDTSIDYHFFTSNSNEADFAKLINDVNAASSLLALTGVGTGVAIMGNIANQWVQQQQAAPPATNATKPPASVKYSDETHTLPAAVELSQNSTVTLRHNRLAVFEVEGGSSLFAADPKAIDRKSVV